MRLSIEEERDIVPLGLAGGLSSTAFDACSAARWRRVATIVCGLRAAMACAGAAASRMSMSVVPSVRQSGALANRRVVAGLQLLPR